MKHNHLSIKGLANILPLLLGWMLLGCQDGQEPATSLGPVFYPPPPGAPRLQFLKSISGGADLGKRETGFSLEDFILGAEDKNVEIVNPYGVAMHGGKIYVCDVGRKKVHVLDLVNRTFESLTDDQRLRNPVNIDFDDQGNIYVADNGSGGVFVFDANHKIVRILGEGKQLLPRDVAIRGDYCYVTDVGTQQVVVLDKNTGEIVKRFGQRVGEASTEPGEFILISDLAFDREGNLYVTDRASGRITKFDASGQILGTYARLGRGGGALVRAKGIALDQADRIWVVDTATAVAKIYNNDGQLLLYFGGSGDGPGSMSMPATIWIDYDHVELFSEYAVPGAKLEFIVLVTSQYGKDKINVYGFGTFGESSSLMEPEPESPSPLPEGSVPEKLE